jgi:hypothetical protein
MHCAASTSPKHSNLRATCRPMSSAAVCIGGVVHRVGVPPTLRAQLRRVAETTRDRVNSMAGGTASDSRPARRPGPHHQVGELPRVFGAWTAARQTRSPLSELLGRWRHTAVRRLRHLDTRRLNAPVATLSATGGEGSPWAGSAGGVEHGPTHEVSELDLPAAGAEKDLRPSELPADPSRIEGGRW